MSVNKVILIGNLGAPPELKHTQSGLAVCTLSLATTDKRKDQSGEWVEQTEWTRVNVWKQTAENCAKYLKKGSKIYVEGKLQTRKWEKDGIERYSTEVTAFTVDFLDSKGAGDSKPEAQKAQQWEAQPQSKPAAPKQVGAGLDDIPF